MMYKESNTATTTESPMTAEKFVSSSYPVGTGYELLSCHRTSVNQFCWSVAGGKPCFRQSYDLTWMFLDDIRQNQKVINCSTIAVLGTNSQCIGIGLIRHPRESRTMSPIEMPFGMFDYLGYLTKFPKFHHGSPFGRGPTRGQSTQVDSCRFLGFILIMVIFFP